MKWPNISSNYGDPTHRHDDDAINIQIKDVELGSYSTRDPGFSATDHHRKDSSKSSGKPLVSHDLVSDESSQNYGSSTSSNVSSLSYSTNTKNGPASIAEVKKDLRKKKQRIASLISAVAVVVITTLILLYLREEYCWHCPSAEEILFGENSQRFLVSNEYLREGFDYRHDHLVGSPQVERVESSNGNGSSQIGNSFTKSSRNLDVKISEPPKRNIPRVVVQSHESWDMLMKEPAQRHHALKLKDKINSTPGWRYHFCSAKCRQEFFEEEVNLGLKIDSSRRTRNGMPYYQLVRWDLTKENGGHDSTTLHTKETNTESITIVPLHVLYNALQIGSAKADFYRYAYMFLNGGIWLDHKSGLWEWEKSIETAVFGDKDDRKDARFLLQVWGRHQWHIFKPNHFGLQLSTSGGNDFDSLEQHILKQRTIELEEKRGYMIRHYQGQEYIMWGWGAEPRHRFTLRVLEDTAFNIFMVGNPQGNDTPGNNGNYISSKNCNWQKMKNNGIKVIAMSGPIVFSNAILKEQARLQHEWKNRVNKSSRSKNHDYSSQLSPYDSSFAKLMGHYTNGLASNGKVLDDYEILFSVNALKNPKTGESISWREFKTPKTDYSVWNGPIVQLDEKWLMK